MHQRERLGTAAFAVTLCMLPTQFAWGLVGHALYTWLSGGTLLLLPPFRQDLLLQLSALCDDFRVTCLPSVPTMWKIVPRMVRPPQGGHLRLVTSGTGPLPAALWRSAADWSGAEVLNVYGITETGWLAGGSQHDLEGDEPCVGESWGCVIRVLDSASTAQPPHLHRVCTVGETGHVWVQSPALMRGYFERDDLTDQVIAGGWFCTGDLGMLDDRGRLLLRGRHKEMINVGGGKVYPADVDAVIAACNDVEDVCTFGVDDALQGETVAVALSLRAGAGLETVYAHTAAMLSAHQVPRRWFVLPQVPRTARGKLDRRAVAAVCAGRPARDAHALARAIDG
jgi:long-chain acyl-CoA synthetase